MKRLVDAINSTWEHREEPVAMTSRKHAPRPLGIWKLLPQTNCKKCGEATCMAFACKLLQRRVSWRAAHPCIQMEHLLNEEHH
jgi:ArsR family metal-binding transcriptional regulator